ncbi:MAG: hypothetical protein AAFZ07_25655 [Actinomycetota bacterium]
MESVGRAETEQGRPRWVWATATAIFGVGLALVIASWIVEDENWTSGFLLEVGVTIWLALPLLWFEQLMEGRFESAEERIESAAERTEQAVELAEEARSAAAATASLVERVLARADHSVSETAVQRAYEVQDELLTRYIEAVANEPTTLNIHLLAGLAAEVNAVPWDQPIMLRTEPPLGIRVQALRDRTKGVIVQLMRDGSGVVDLHWKPDMSYELFVEKVVKNLQTHGLLPSRDDEPVSGLPAEIARAYAELIEARTNPQPSDLVE